MDKQELREAVKEVLKDLRVEVEDDRGLGDPEDTSRMLTIKVMLGEEELSESYFTV